MHNEGVAVTAAVAVTPAEAVATSAEAAISAEALGQVASGRWEAYEEEQFPAAHSCPGERCQAASAWLPSIDPIMTRDTVRISRSDRGSIFVSVCGVDIRITTMGIRIITATPITATRIPTAICIPTLIQNGTRTATLVISIRMRPQLQAPPIPTQRRLAAPV